MGLPRRCPADIFTLLADIDDVLQYVADTREANPALEDLPRFLIVRGFGVVRDCGYATAPSRVTLAMNACLQGHSMGGAIAYLTSRRSEDVWTGVVFSGPGGCLATAGVRPEFARLTVDCVWCCSHKAGPCCCDTSEANRRQSVGLLAAKGATRGNAGACRLVAVSLCVAVPHRTTPQLQMDKLGVDKVCSDPAVVQNYQADPLVYHGGMQVRWGLSIMRALDHISSGACKVARRLRTVASSCLDPPPLRAASRYPQLQAAVLGCTR